MNISDAQLSLRAVFISELCFGRLPHYNMAATQNRVQLLLISSISLPNLLCFGIDLNQSHRSKLIARNGYGPNCFPFLFLFYLFLFFCPTYRPTFTRERAMGPPRSNVSGSFSFYFMRFHSQ